MLTYLVCSVLHSELRARQDLVAENLALRQQLAVLTRPKRRPRLTPAWASRPAAYPKEVRDLVRRMARENPRWRSISIQRDLRKLGSAVSAQSVRRYRRGDRRRPPLQRWRTFLRNHAPRIWAADSFTVQTLIQPARLIAIPLAVLMAEHVSRGIASRWR